VSDTTRRRSDDVFADLVAALNADPNGAGDGFARLDYGRRGRTGVPEIILAAGKTEQQVLELAERMLARTDRVLISRVEAGLAAKIRNRFSSHTTEYHERASMVRIASHRSRISETGGAIAIFTAGTSDVPLAEEAGLVAEEMGCSVRIIADVGVAGLHRVIQPLRQVLDGGFDVIIVVAGMDGALPSVVSGLSPIPVIGLPSSVGYGFGGRGEAALMSMLQTCSPGLSVVNIDNSVGAAAAAATIANAVASARRARSE
jgi:pyridinium-3,5-biscarboxylic acid mononucleotide synthase